MNSDQILNLVTHDPFLKQKKVFVVSESNLPYKLPINHVFFVLISNRRRKIKGENTILGHWILIETLSISKKNYKRQIGYFDPMGFDIFSTKIRKKLERSVGYSNIFINKICYQHKLSAICGSIVCYIALLRSRGFSYSEISRKKISPNLLFNVKYIPLFIKSLLTKKYQMLPRFSLDFL